MVRRSRRDDPDALRRSLIDTLDNFEDLLARGDLRSQVKGLVPAFRTLRDLGCSLVEDEDAVSARSRILAYLRANVGQVVSGEELMVVSGISEYARRLRELRVEHGWPIVSGGMARRMAKGADPDEEVDDGAPGEGDPDRHEDYMGVDSYMLVEDRQDFEAAQRWRLANTIRRSLGGVRDKLLWYFRANVGKPVMGDELIYVAGFAKEWARRVRELRTEYGWPIATQFTGRPDLPMGAYILEEDRQSPPHDRRIPDPERRKALVRDGHTCRGCGWNHDLWNPSDPRHLELHHEIHHARGGGNTADNLVTLCNICHDERHRRERISHL